MASSPPTRAKIVGGGRLGTGRCSLNCRPCMPGDWKSQATVAKPAYAGWAVGAGGLGKGRCSLNCRLRARRLEVAGSGREARLRGLRQSA
jgi:hypothetical protein